MKKDMNTRTVQFEPGARNIFFHILTRCNLKCRHCYINKDEQGEETLPIEIIQKWLEVFVSNTIKKGHGTKKTHREEWRDRFRLPANEEKERTNVIFLGGEPTLNPALPDAIQFARGLGVRSITVDTNGYLFNGFLSKVTPDLLDMICFSLDGSSPEVNDPIRGRGSFEVCTRGIRKARDLGFSVGLIFTVSALNLHDLENMYKILEDLGVERFFIQVVGIRGRPARRGESFLQVDWETWEAIVPKVARSIYEGLGIPVSYPKVYLDDEEEFVCAGVVAENYFVFPNGRVYTCPLCEDLPLHAYEMGEGGLIIRPPLTELDLFGLKIPEGCVMNRLLHPENIPYDESGRCLRRIACCMVKEEPV